MRNICLFGGTFDPPHKGHVEIVRSLAESFEAVWVLPCASHPLKDRAHASQQDRLQMCQRAFEGMPNVSILPRPECTTIDLVDALSSEHPDARWTLALGSDIAQELDRWHRVDDLLARVSLYWFGRVGYPQQYVPLDRPVPPECSSSAFRAHMFEGRLAEARAMVPPHVWAYIEHNGLYGVWRAQKVAARRRRETQGVGEGRRG